MAQDGVYIAGEQGQLAKTFRGMLAAYSRRGHGAVRLLDGVCSGSAVSMIYIDHFQIDLGPDAPWQERVHVIRELMPRFGEQGAELPDCTVAGEAIMADGCMGWTAVLVFLHGPGTPGLDALESAAAAWRQRCGDIQLAVPV
jgi:hypothetical protein